MFKVRFAVAAATVALAASAAGYAVAANLVSSSEVPAGVTRYAMVSAEDAQTTTSTTFVNIPGLSASIVVPSGKHGDLIVDFSGEVNGCSAISVRAVIDGTAAVPSATQLFWPDNIGAQSHGFTFYKKGVPGGTHTVAIQWQELTSCAQAFISSRSMVVTANIR